MVYFCALYTCSLRRCPADCGAESSDGDEDSRPRPNMRLTRFPSVGSLSIDHAPIRLALTVCFLEDVLDRGPGGFGLVARRGIPSRRRHGLTKYMGCCTRYLRVYLMWLALCGILSGFEVVLIFSIAQVGTQ